MRFIILIIVIIVAVIAGFITLKLSGEGPPPQPTLSAAPAASEVRTVDVLVARVDIPVGAVIDDSMIDKQPWPEHLVLSGFVVSGTPEANLEGMVARSEFKAREPIIMTKLAKPNDASFLAAGLPRGMRAV